MAIRSEGNQARDQSGTGSQCERIDGLGKSDQGDPRAGLPGGPRGGTSGETPGRDFRGDPGAGLPGGPRGGTSGGTPGRDFRGDPGAGLPGRPRGGTSGGTPGRDFRGDPGTGLPGRPRGGTSGETPGRDFQGDPSLGAAGASDGFQSLQKKLLEELKDYKFVFPHVVSGKEKRSVAKPPQRSYPYHVSISVQLEGKDLTLDLKRNNLLLPRGFQVSHYDSNGTLVTKNDTELYRCCYEGSVRKFPGSQISASICSGLSALIVFSNRTYIIEHLEGDKDGRHLLYRPEDLPPGQSTCGVNNISLELTLTKHLQRSQRVKRDLLTEMKYLELAMVADNAMYQNLGSNKDAVVRRLLNIANTVDLYYRPFNIRVALIGVEVWSRDQIRVDRSASGTMNRFLRWRKSTLLPRMYNDNSHLITGSLFEGGVAGLATFGGICSFDHSGGVSTDSLSSYLALAATLAHEVGHNLGISHDTDLRNCNCPDVNAGCIMEDALGFTSPTQFSSCSHEDIDRSLLSGLGMCLYNLPDVDKLVGGPECGNLYVEKGEECDCGNPAECSDPCCEPLTCKLKPGASCSSTGTCCKDCQFLPASTVCRPSAGECDLPEFCTGNFSRCPINMYLKDGHTCSEGNLYCSGGICLSADRQCQEVWGEGATSAEHTCYRFTNKGGNEFGNCGKDEHDEYIKCKNEDVDCGKIQCKGGNATPLRGGYLSILTTKFVIKGVKYECRGTFSTFQDSSAPDLVRQGTKCGDNKACFETKCQDIRLFNVQNCDQTCNNKGVCNNKDQCHCQEGWAPPFCAVRGPGGSIDSGPMNVTMPAASPTKMVTDKNITAAFQRRTQGTTTMTVAIAVPALALLNVAGLLTWYKMKKAGETSAANETSASERTEENRIQFLCNEEVVQIQSPDIDTSTTLQYPLPNTKV
ncbi:disintegrin and metalloproteinase domain-containing protein 12-like [Cetorhinus maximus]